MAEKIISPGVFTNEIDQTFLPTAVADIGGLFVALSCTVAGHVLFWKSHARVRRGGTACRHNA